MTRLAEIAKHIRNRMKVAGLKAKCRCYESCGWSWITINPVTFEAEFSEDTQRTILHIAKVNGLTYAQGMEINLEQLTAAKGVTFVVPSEKLAVA